MKASVVVPTYNSCDVLRNCLLSLQGQQVEGTDDFEVMVVDDGSTDATADIVRQLMSTTANLKYLHLPRTELSSRGAARNSGARDATGDVLIFLDGDQIVPSRFVAQHLDHHRDVDHAAVIGFRRFLAPGPSDVEKFALTGDESFLAPISSDDLRHDLLARLSYLPGELETVWHLFYSCNVSVRRDRFWDVGGSCVEFRGWGLEDCELGYKLARIGCQFVMDASNVIYHQGYAIEPESNIYLRWQQNLAVFMRIHDYPIEVVLQKVLAPFFDPAQGADWIDCYERFELAVRAAYGRPILRSSSS